MIESLADIMAIVSSNGLFLVYLILFILKCIEGPVVLILAAFVASQGYLNIWIVFILGVLSGVIPDLILYILGRYLRTSSVERICSYFGLNHKRLLWLEKKIKEHAIKSVIIVKTVPPLPVPGLILTGFMKMDFKIFFLTQLILNTVGVAIFVLIGFFMGLFTINLLDFVKFSWLLPPALLLIIAFFYFLGKYALSHLFRLFRSF